MTVCRKCNGKGKVLDYVAERNCHGEWETVLREIPCDKCQREPMTNEEYIRSLTTEQLAEILTDIQTDGYYKTDCMNYEERLAWLKEIHNEVSTL